MKSTENNLWALKVLNAFSKLSDSDSQWCISIYRNTPRIEFGGSINSFSKTKFIANYRESSPHSHTACTGSHTRGKAHTTMQIWCRTRKLIAGSFGLRLECDFCLSKRLADASSRVFMPVCVFSCILVSLAYACVWAECERDAPALPIGRHN